MSLLNDHLFSSRRRLRIRRPVVGAIPGELSLSAEESSTEVQVHCYSAEQLQQDSEQLASYCEQSEKVVWIDVCGLGQAEKIQRIAQLAEIPELMLEDMVNVPQHSGVNSYDDRLLIVTRMVTADSPDRSHIEQVSLYLYKNLVVTFQEDNADVFEPIRRRLKKSGDILRRQPASFLIYSLLDVIVDAYFPAVEQMVDRIQLLEQLALTRPRPDLLRHLSSSRNEVIRLNRAILPQKEMIQQLVREKMLKGNHHIHEHLKDVLDHSIQASETTELLREMSATLLNLYMSAMANRTNEKMKVLTIMASVFIPLTFIVGVYGMNFDHMPELHYRWSYPIVWGVMIVIALVLMAYFYSKGWLVERDRNLEEILQEASEEATGKHKPQPTVFSKRTEDPAQDSKN